MKNGTLFIELEDVRSPVSSQEILQVLKRTPILGDLIVSEPGM